jgi:hypothetical protein
MAREIFERHEDGGIRWILKYADGKRQREKASRSSSWPS